MDIEDFDDEDMDTGNAYFYSKESGFVETESMPAPRSYHACGLHQGQAVVAAGGFKTSYYFSPDTQTWHTGPDLPIGGFIEDADFVSWKNRAFLVADKFIWELTGEDKTTWEWELVAKMETYRGNFKAFVMPAEYCRG